MLLRNIVVIIFFTGVYIGLMWKLDFWSSLRKQVDCCENQVWLLLISRLASGNSQLWANNIGILFWLCVEEMALELDLNNSWFGMYFQGGNKFELGRGVHAIWCYFTSRVSFVWTVERTDRFVLRQLKHTGNFDSSSYLCSHQWTTLTFQYVAKVNLRPTHI